MRGADGEDRLGADIGPFFSGREIRCTGPLVGHFQPVPSTFGIANQVKLTDARAASLSIQRRRRLDRAKLTTRQKKSAGGIPWLHVAHSCNRARRPPPFWLPVPWAARAANAPGVTATEIKIGQTMPYSGPASAFGTIGRTEVAYFHMVNDLGGINGRKVNLISLDDGYSATKTVEQTRRLIEQEQVAFIFGSVGTAPNAAIRSYLNENKIPQLFVASGFSMFADPHGFNPSYRSEGRAFAKYIVSTKPDAKIAVLYQNDDLGKDYLNGVKDGLGTSHAAMLVKEASYEVSEPTVDSQVVSLQDSGANTLIVAANAKAAAQAIRKAYDLEWMPERYLGSTAASITSVPEKPAGSEKSKGVITNYWGKDPADPRWADDPAASEWAVVPSWPNI